MFIENNKYTLKLLKTIFIMNIKNKNNKYYYYNYKWQLW